MKFSTPNGKNFKTIAMMVVGGVLGVVVGRAGFAAIHDGEATGTPEEINKRKMLGYAKRGGLAAAGIAASSAITTNDDVSLMAKTAGVAVASIQAVDGLADMAAESSKMQALTVGSKTEKIAARAMGLKCPGDCNAMMAIPMERPRNRYKKGMNGPGTALDAEDQFQLLEGSAFSLS